MENKICNKCNTDKPISEYYRIKKKNGGYYEYNYCKKCHYEKMTKETSKQWRKSNPKAWLKANYKANRAFFDRQKKGVYLLVTDKGLYVGASDKLRSRIQQHKLKLPGNVGFKGAKILYHKILLEENDKEIRLKKEREFIELLQPELNQLYTHKYKTYFEIINAKKKK